MEHILAKNGSTQWRIVMAHPAHETVKLAADELNCFVMQMSGAALPVQTELVADGDYEILLGNSGRLAHYGLAADWDSLGEEGYVIKSGEHYLLLAGATPRGTLYAAYAFLEEELGVRWFASDCTRVLSVARVEQWIAENPDCRVFSVAQNDCGNWCTCPACKAIDDEEGTPAGSTIRFANAVADAIAEKHPDVLIHTFAYQYTRKAPKHVRPRHNVIVRLCSIECCFSHPLNGNLNAALAPGANEMKHPQCAALGETAFLDDLREWSKITDRLYVWDYVTQFRGYLTPMPNFDVIDQNLRLFRDIGVKGILEQGNFSHGGGGHLAELEAYLQAKLMWNPDCDMETHLIDFLNGYYGEAAAPLIREYIETWQVEARKRHVGIYYRYDAPMISDELLDCSAELLGRALFLTEGAQERRRIEKLMPDIQYLLLLRMPMGTPGRDALITAFGWRVREAGVTELRERWTLDETLEQMRTVPVDEWKRTVINDYKM